MRIYPIKLYLLSLPNLIPVVFSVVCNIGIWIVLILQIKPQEDFVFLHYNVLFGVDTVGPWWHVFWIPLVGTIILILNTLLGWYFFEKDKFASSLLNVVTFFVHLHLAIGTYLLVYLNV